MKIGNIYQETNYQRFKKLEGNRNVLPARKKKIRDSIEAVGYILNPIIVNEKMEIIDGQGRFEVLKDMHLPIDYIIAEGAGVKECISMNINQSNWQLIDYIQCYSEMGNIAYKYLYALYIAYRKLGINPIINAIRQQKVGLRHGGCSTQMGQEIVKSGQFDCTQKEYEEAERMLAFLKNVSQSIENISGGRKDVYYLAIEFAYRNPNVDNCRLTEKLLSAIDLNPCANISQALDELTRIYNYNIRKYPKIYLANDYQRMLDAK